MIFGYLFHHGHWVYYMCLVFLGVLLIRTYESRRISGIFRCFRLISFPVNTFVCYVHSFPHFLYHLWGREAGLAGLYLALIVVMLTCIY